jgi:16S rRNA (cytidine1402-2'-O)-methyltransferase
MARQKSSSGSRRGECDGGPTRTPGARKPQHLGDLKEGHARESDLAPGLYVTATPIGNARDITLRALDVLGACDLIAAEDTRVTAKLLSIHGISRPLTAYNDHNAERERPRLLERLHQGHRIVLVSDAGTPLVSDPGFKLVRAVIEEGLPVHVLPGPSAVLAGLALSGLPSDRFLFAGFLPSKTGERRTALEEFKNERATLIFFESGPRLADCLGDMSAVLGARRAVVAREITKLHEEVRRGNLSELAQAYAQEGAPRGEVTLLVSGAPRSEIDFALVDDALAKALAFMPLKPASEMIAGLLGISRHAVYARGLEKKNG